MQTTGDLVSYDTDGYLQFDSNTANIGTGPYTLVMNDDGKVHSMKGAVPQSSVSLELALPTHPLESHLTRF
jgi:hypothetical protein